MLVRTIRVTDRLTNALLRLSAWASMAIVVQATYLKNGLFGIVINAVRTVVVTVASVFGLAFGAAQRTTQTAQQVVAVTTTAVESTSSRRRQRMAQRAEEAALKATVAEDPLRAQNRALSAFVVLLLVVLVSVVLLQSTDSSSEGDTLSAGPGVSWPQVGAGSPQPTVAGFPTEIPSPTPIPDPLRAGGSLVFSMRENGQEDLWVMNVGEAQDPIRITNDPADDRDPAWSPDGRRVAFSSNRDGNWELYILEIDTGLTNRLTFTPGFEGAPTWSPDGAWLAFEGYYADTQDLEIYYISSDPARAATEGAGRITYTPGPDIEPAWMPGEGRNIAFSSWRSGTNQDIYIISLDSGGGDSQAANLTNTPDQDENHPAWSRDAARIAYSAVVDGIPGVYVQSAETASSPQSSPQLAGRGKMPTWSPDSGTLAFVLDARQRSQIITGVPGGFGAAAATALPHLVSDPDWTPYALPEPIARSGGLAAAPEVAEPLYTENARLQATQLYGLAPLSNVNTALDEVVYLSDRVNESFEALRISTLKNVGHDFLGNLESAFWLPERPPEPGEPKENWHYTGRAFAINRSLIYASAPGPIAVVREEREINTYWTIYVRVAEEAQNGSLGEPLRTLPWDFAARSSGSVEDYERGGRLAANVPKGYYVNLTQLAADYGWERMPALRTWEYNFGAIQFWEFVKSEGLDWQGAMLEIYTAAEFNAFLSDATPIPPPPALPTPSPTPDVRRSPTPIPPDQQ